MSTRRPARILWADDQHDVAASFAQLLSPLDPEVVFVADGSAALDTLRSEWFDCVMLDLRMPPGDWGGLWFLEQATGGPLPPVIVLSGEGRQRETIAALRLGAKDYVLKDDVQDDLLASVQRVLANSKDEIERIVALGESQSLEFKSTLRTSTDAGSTDRRLERACLKTIGAFLNGSEPGSLLIGVRDDGTPVGLDLDLATLRKPDRNDLDSFALHLTQLVRARLGVLASTLARVSFEDLDGVDICHVRCTPSPQPVWYRDASEESLFIRANSSTMAINGRDLEDYLSARWPISRPNSRSTDR